MSGVFDLWGSRRTSFERCEWYQRNEKATRDLSKIVFNDKPSAVFYAKEANSATYQKQDLGGVFLADESIVMIETNDTLDGIKGGDKVKFRGNLWMVTSVQQTESHKQTQFISDTTKKTFISLKR